MDFARFGFEVQVLNLGLFVVWTVIVVFIVMVIMMEFCVELGCGIVDTWVLCWCFVLAVWV